MLNLSINRPNINNKAISYPEFTLHIIQGVVFMPIFDHLSPEILDIADFDSFHSQWASKIVAALNKILPKGFRAKAHTSIGTREVDVRTDRTLGVSEKQRLISRNRIPDSPIVSEATFPDVLEVFVDYIDRGRQITVGVIEIVSRANKDRPGSRNSFVSKCSNLLSQNVSLVIVDILAPPFFNLHNQLLEALDIKMGRLKEDKSTPLYCASYCQILTEENKPAIEFWRYSLKVGDILPQLPLFITSDIAVPVNLEQTYMESCDELKVFEE